jgi:hypothetical protein
LTFLNWLRAQKENLEMVERNVIGYSLIENICMVAINIVIYTETKIYCGGLIININWIEISISACHARERGSTFFSIHFAFLTCHAIEVTSHMRPLLKTIAGNNNAFDCQILDMYLQLETLSSVAHFLYSCHTVIHPPKCIIHTYHFSFSSGSYPPLALKSFYLV